MVEQVANTRPEPICGMNTWMPVPARILAVREENFNTRTYTLHFIDEQIRKMYRFVPGQFNMLYVPGVGEAAISISSDPCGTETLDHTIRLVGSVTRAVERLESHAVVGLRGPFGRGWPLEAMEGKDVVIVAGGIGLAPLRPVVYWLLQNRESLPSRGVALRLPHPGRPRLCQRAGTVGRRQAPSRCSVTVDNATGAWAGPVGVVTSLLRRIKVNAERTIVLVCGPKVLNHVAAWNFLQLHVPPEHVYVSLERNMNCGFGRCGHCQYGAKFMCKDGPVFCFSEVADIFGKEEI